MKKNNEGIVPESGIITFKEPEVTAEANNTMTQRTIGISTAIILVNNGITTLVTLQLRHSKSNSNLNVLKAHTNIFSAIKLIDQHKK